MKTLTRLGSALLLTAAFHGAPLQAASKAAIDAAAAQISKGDAVLVDVRELDEIKGGMAAPAMWLATSEIKAQGPRFKDIMKTLPKNKPIYVYCASGGRSGQFVDGLKAQGYDAKNLGGFPDWRDAGKPVKPVADASDKPCPFLCRPGT
jgi:rhodanese-related sulfurtransferase